MISIKSDDLRTSSSASVCQSRRAFLGSLCASAYAQSNTAPPARVRLVRELSRNRGVFDISRDGALLAAHRNIGSRTCANGPGCHETFHEVQVLRADTHRPVRSIKMSFGTTNEFSSWVINFVPGTGDLLLRGKIPDQPGQTSFFLWNAITGNLRMVPEPESGLEFVACVDGERVLGTLPVRNGRPKRVVWTLGTRNVGEISPSFDPAADVDLMAALVSDYRGGEYIVRQLRIEVTGHIYNAVPMPGGKLAVISGKRALDGDLDHRRHPAFLGVYDLQSRKLLRQTQLLNHEPLVDRTALIGGMPYTDGLIGHLGYQVACSPDGRYLALSYERYDAANRLLAGILRREPRFAVYETNSLTFVGAVSHPKETLFDPGWAQVSPAVGGKLLFSRDGQHLYTTVQAARQWQIS